MKLCRISLLTASKVLGFDKLLNFTPETSRTKSNFHISPELGVGIPGHCAGRWKGAGAQSDPWKIRKLPWGISAEDRHWRLAKRTELVMTTWRKKFKWLLKWRLSQLKPKRNCCKQWERLTLTQMSWLYLW